MSPHAHAIPVRPTTREHRGILRRAAGWLACWGLVVGVTSTSTHAQTTNLPSDARSPAATVTRRTIPSERIFLPSEDLGGTWKKTVDQVASEAPIARLQPPAQNSSALSGDGFIETSWVPLPAADATSTAKRRAFVHFMPSDGGAWLDTDTEVEQEGRAAVPYRLASVLDSKPILSNPPSSLHQLAFWSTADEGSAENQVRLAQAQWMPTPGESGVSMPPVYPAGSWRSWFPSHPALGRGFTKVGSDYSNFYSCESLVGLTAAFGAGALMANTGFDTTMQTAWQNSITPTGFGQFIGGTKFLGEGRYELPVWGAAAVTGLLLSGNPTGDVIGEWGSRSLRMFVVGAPPLYVMQQVTGSSRPGESSAGSHWHFLNDNNGVSGHAFIGAVPFLAAAEMVENPWAKGGLYACSTLCAFSRVDVNAHYPSEVFLGWYLAVASSIAINRTEIRFAGIDMKVVPLPVSNGSGVALEGRW